MNVGKIMKETNTNKKNMLKLLFLTPERNTNKANRKEMII